MYVYGKTIKKNEELTNIRFWMVVTSVGKRKGNAFGKLQMYLTNVIGSYMRSYFIIVYKMNKETNA